MADRVDVLHLFPEERRLLLDLLAGLEQDQWGLPTVCPGWSVGDIVRHLLGDDLGRLSRVRDAFTSPTKPLLDERTVDLVNRLNEAWVTAARRLSPRTLCDLLDTTSAWTLAHFATLDLDAIGTPVSWAGPEPAPVWLDLAREYTERWHHQQQIRDALGAPELVDAHLFHPVLATFAYALPVTFVNTEAADRSAVHLHISGDAGGDWSVQRQGDRWRLYVGAPPFATARVVMDQGVAWRLFTKGLSPAEAKLKTVIDGDQELGGRLLQTVSVIA